MTLGSVFELAEEIVSLHERDEGRNRTRVVKVVVDDLAVAMPVFDAIAELAQGVVLDSSKYDVASGVSPTSDASRQAKVEAALKVDRKLAPKQVKTRQLGDDKISVAFAGSSDDQPVSSGELPFLQVGLAVLDNQLDRRPLAIIVYRSGELDRDLQPVVWKMFDDALIDMEQSGLRTLIVVTEAQIDVQMHCGFGDGFRFGIEELRFLSRSSSTDVNVQALAFAEYEGNIVLFLGAGFSASSGMPIGNGLRDAAIQRLLGTAAPHEVQELPGRFYDWLVPDHHAWLTTRERGLTRREFTKNLTLEQVVRIEQKVLSGFPTLRDFKVVHDSVLGSPGDAVNALRSYLSFPKIRPVIVEVNFDLLVEEWIGKQGVAIRVFSTPAEFAEAASYLSSYLGGEDGADAIPVLKLHGTINDFDSCVVTSDVTEDGLGNTKLSALRALIGTEAEPTRWWYIGASMRDLDLTPILELEDFGHGIDERWVTPYVVESIQRYADTRLDKWKKDHVGLPLLSERVVTQTADVFLRAVVNAGIAVA